MFLPEEQSEPVPASAHRRPFPWRCSNCKKKEVRLSTVPYTAKVKQDGRIYEIAIQALEIPRCDACGELVFNDSADEQVSAALRDYLHLLTPDQIRRSRKALDLTQRELSNRLGVAEATLSRWETGALIQSRAMDNLLRAYFGLPEVRAALRGEGQDPGLGIAPVFERMEPAADRGA